MNALKNGDKKIQKKQKNNGVASIKPTPKKLKEKREKLTQKESSFLNKSLELFIPVLKLTAEDAYDTGYKAGKRRIIFLTAYYICLISIGLLIGNLIARFLL